jgi:predicted Zn-dependent peptidase
VVGVGSRAEERRTNGLTHYIEHMLFKGTAKRPDAIEISTAIEGAGGSLNAYTTKEVTAYWNHLPFDKLSLGMDVLADTLQNSLLDPAEIERERTVVQAEIRRSHDQPGAWAGELLSTTTYGDQPIGWPIAGTEETVGALQRPDFVDHLSRWYKPHNMVLSVGGNMTHEEVVDLAADLFGGLAPGETPTPCRPANCRANGPSSRNATNPAVPSRLRHAGHRPPRPRPHPSPSQRDPDAA